LGTWKAEEAWVVGWMIYLYGVIGRLYIHIASRFVSHYILCIIFYILVFASKNKAIYIYTYIYQRKKQTNHSRTQRFTLFWRHWPTDLPTTRSSSPTRCRSLAIGTLSRWVSWSMFRFFEKFNIIKKIN
jgi:hypothetical protein